MIMATPNNDSQNPLANDDDMPSSAADETTNGTRRSEAEDRAIHGQSLAKGDTGGGHGTGVPADVQGISNRPGDSPEHER